ncbi:TKL family protein kinase [Tritrichomonas foetus]|uniref:TKL family protein kinase n=1 Tax=Tritrichomonas foetus TaxID=1144522 RepID=A0A1J4J8K3_9EUKA|nr:TKL family protein kinase [Tritrichomonas foetus]|eukprot:OHS95025.1 TKL family protein kinase [Tritrichomonas foetus]
MGTGLSANYNNITPHFTFGIWKVSRAVQKTSDKKVSLWTIDYQVMKERERNKKNRRHYIQYLLTCLQAQQRIQHLNILKIFEVRSAKKKIGFASEPIEMSLLDESKFTRDEAMYIAQQLAIVLRYVHDNLHLAHLGLCPEQIFLNDHFTLKLGMFLHSVPIQTEIAPIQDPFIHWSPNSIFHVPGCWCAPEIVNDEAIIPSADVYMYALICIYVFSGEKPSATTSNLDIDTAHPLVVLKSLPEEFHDILKHCLTIEPTGRPTFDAILHDPAFSSLVCGIYQYLDVIQQKDQRDLFNFFIGLKSAITVFSNRLIKKKFTPLFTYYLKKDMRFALALLPLLFLIINRFEIREYVNDVLRPIKHVFVQVENPRVTNILLEYLGMLLNRIPSEYHEEIVFPITYSALQSPDPRAVINCTALMPNIIELMSVNAIRSDLAPVLLKSLDSTQVPDVMIAIVNLLNLCMCKTGPDYIAQEAIPVIKRVWERSQWPTLAEPIADLVELCDVPVELMFLSSLQMALSIISVPQVPKNIQARMILFVEKSLQKINKDRKISKIDFDEAANHVVYPPKFPHTKLKDKLKAEEEEDEDESDDHLDTPNIAQIASNCINNKHEEEESSSSSSSSSDSSSESQKISVEPHSTKAPQNPYVNSNKSNNSPRSPQFQQNMQQNTQLNPHGNIRRSNTATTEPQYFPPQQQQFNQGGSRGSSQNNSSNNPFNSNNGFQTQQRPINNQQQSVDPYNVESKPGNRRSLNFDQQMDLFRNNNSGNFHTNNTNQPNNFSNQQYGSGGEQNPNFDSFIDLQPHQPSQQVNQQNSQPSSNYSDPSRPTASSNPFDGFDFL